MAAERRAAKAQAASSSNIFSGAVEEAQLIVWPSLQEAVINTFVVIAMVFVSAAMLFGVNTGLAAVSNAVYKPSSSASKPEASAESGPARPEAPQLRTPPTSSFPSLD
eukprot:scaffold285023_cov45-Prasinocladus_malaysianus.AAC.1